MLITGPSIWDFGGARWQSLGDVLTAAGAPPALSYDFGLTDKLTFAGSQVREAYPTYGGLIPDDILQQTVVANQPTWGPLALCGGRPGIGSPDALRKLQSIVATTTIAAPYTLIIVGVPPAAGGVYWFDAASTVGNMRSGLVFRSGTTYYVWTGSLSWNTSIAIDAAAGVCVTVRVDGGSSYFRARKSTGTLSTDVFTAAGNFRGLTAGGYVNAGSGSINSLTSWAIVPGAALTVAQIQAVETWLQRPAALGGCGFTGWVP